MALRLVSEGPEGLVFREKRSPIAAVIWGLLGTFFVMSMLLGSTVDRLVCDAENCVVTRTEFFFVTDEVLRFERSALEAPTTRSRGGKYPKYELVVNVAGHKPLPFESNVLDGRGDAVEMVERFEAYLDKKTDHLAVELDGRWIAAGAAVVGGGFAFFCVLGCLLSTEVRCDFEARTVTVTQRGLTGKPDTTTVHAEAIEDFPIRSHKGTHALVILTRGHDEKLGHAPDELEARAYQERLRHWLEACRKEHAS